MRAIVLIFVSILVFKTLGYAEISSNDTKLILKVKKENGKFIVDNGSRIDTVANGDELREIYLRDNKDSKKSNKKIKKLKKNKITSNNKKIVPKDLSNNYLSFKESYQFKVDTIKYSLPVKTSAFDFKKKQVIVTLSDKNGKVSNSNGYSYNFLDKKNLKKAILLFDCENRTEPKRFGTTGNSREAFGKTHSLQFNDDKIISFQFNKIGVWNSNSTLEKLFETELSFSGDKFIIKNNTVYGSGSYPLLIDSVKSCIKLDFEKSKYEEGTYDISSSKAFDDISDFEKRYRLDRLFIKDDETSNNADKYFSESVLSGTSLLFPIENSFFILNNSGKAILEMDYNLNTINSYPINELIKRRDLELDKITLNDIKNDFNSPMLRISRLLNFFYNQYKEEFYIQIDNSKFMMGKGLPDKEIWVYSIERKKVIKKIPFDRRINGFDPKTNRISCIRDIDDQNFEVQIYEIK
ncbi:MAG: hypothetical protein CR982_01720 [Candidatus Cloacimonadota bacterium]|nr:MAG: hypothetical protein CR982_01720 [Candidatus Cloacimonadota bacterium]PIE78153.1 MAG: hypothetical protein CSA15_09310 [Candidatus Delongbacteria bacterium]